MKKIIVLGIIGILLVSSVLSIGIFYFMKNGTDDEKKEIDDLVPSDDDGLSEEVKERWRQYSDEVDSPEVIKTDPDIVTTSPGEELEKMVELEGLNDFKDTAYGSTGGNTTQEGFFERDGDGSYDVDNTAVPTDDKNEALGGGEGEEEREVEEADLVKVIDDTLYVLNSYRGLIAIDISDPEESHIVGQCSVVGYPVEMYVVDFLAIIVVRTDYTFWYRYWAMEETDTADKESSNEGTIGTTIYIVNVDDPSEPKILKIVELEGYAAESRRVGTGSVAQTDNKKGRPFSRPLFTFLREANASRRNLLARRFPRRRGFGLLLGFEVFAGHLIDHLHRQPRLAAVVEAEQLDLDLVAFLDDVGSLLHAIGRELADMHQTVAGAEEVYEGAELHHLDHGAFVDLADFRV